MSFYLKLNLIIIALPFLCSFFPAFKFYRNLRPLLFSFVVVGGFYIGWDILFTARGIWSFNPQYVSGGRFFGLPYEELLFFVAVPYSCLFLYEGMAKYILDRGVGFSQGVYAVTAGAIIYLALAFYSKIYTFTVLMLCGLMLLIMAFWAKRYLSSFVYWLWIMIVMILFFIFNYFLTSLPVVIYNPSAITNCRLATIPIEDFVYNFTLLSLYLMAYLLARPNQR